MKTKIFIGSCVLFLWTTLVNAQTSPPELISYQGIARDASGKPLVNQFIGIQLKIRQGAANGMVFFTETHTVTTNSLGLFSLQIGSNNPSEFQSISWNNGPYFLEVLMDPNGGSSYTSIGTQQLLSVPYALYSKKSKFADTALYAPSGSITINSSGIVSVSPSSGNAFTISATPPSFTSSDGITNITGDYPNYVVTTATPTLSILGNSLSISGGNTVILPTPTIIGQGIASITSPSVNSFTIDVPSPTLNIIQSPGQATISLLQGTSSTSTILTFPTSSVTLYGSGIASVSPNGSPSSTFTVNVPTQTLTLTGNGNTIPYSITSTHGGTVTLPSPIISINPPHLISNSTGSYNIGITIQSPTILPSTPSSTNIISVSSNSANLTYTLTVPPATLSASSSTTGITTITINQGSAFDTATFNILPAIQNNAWGVNGNTVTSSNYLGTNNSADLIFKTNNTERMRISSTGAVGIGTNTPTAQLHIVTTSSNTANIALQIDDGHIKASPSSSISFTFTHSGTAPTGSFVTGNDVRGQCGLTFSSGHNLNAGGYYKFIIPFSKSYSNIPYIILTPASSLYGLTLRVGNVTTTNFEIILEHQPGNSIASIFIPAATFLINYFVIE